MSAVAPSSFNTAYILANSRKDDGFYFAACAASIGFELAPDTPGVDNVFSKDNKYEPGKQGDCKFYFSPITSTGYPLKGAREVWLDWRESFAAIQTLPRRIAAARTSAEFTELSSEAMNLEIAGAVGSMRLFTLGHLSIYDPHIVSSEEHLAQMMLDEAPAQIAKLKGGRDAKAYAVKLAASWQPAMHSWVKCWVQNYTELQPVWKSAPVSFRIDRPTKAMPLVLTQGPNLEMLKREWL